MRWLVVLGVCAAWVLIGVVLGSQAALGLTMQGSPVSLASAVRTSLMGALPWIPSTLIAIGMAAKFPVTRSTWMRVLPLHLLAIPVTAWIANVGVVAGFWWMAGTFAGLTALAGQAAFWATIRIHVAALVYLGTLSATQAWLYIRDARARQLSFARLEAQLAQARFRALNEQIRPHFLFNTLHTIGQMWRSGRSDEAEEMLDHLGSLFQRVRSYTERPMIPLSEELSMVEEYLAIERARFSDRLRVAVEATADAKACLVPPLLLQPLVENAIRHGVSPARDARSVHVRATTVRDRLVLEVQDDGMGMDNDSPSAGSGTGLSNTRARLEHLFDGEHTIDIVSPNGGGTTVRIDIPAVVDEDGARWSGE